MDTPETDSRSAWVPPVDGEPVTALPPAEGSRPDKPSELQRGVLVGLRAGAIVAGPIASVVLFLGLAFMAFNLGAGGGLGVPRLVLSAMRFFLAVLVLSALLGAMIGVVGSLFARALPGILRPSWWPSGRWAIFGRRAQGTTSFPGRRRFRWLKFVAALFVLVEVAAFGAGSYLHRVVGVRLAQAIAGAERDDSHWRLDDLFAHREPVPDAQNSALIVDRVVQSLPGGWPPDPPQDDEGGTLSPSEAYDQLLTTPDNVRLGDAVAASLRADLEARADAVQIARTVADYPHGRHEYELGPGLIDTPLDETQAARNVARLLSADAGIRAHDGDLDGALDSCRAGLCVARSIGDEPFVIGQIVRVAIGGVALKSARRVVGQGEPSEAALARFQALTLDELQQPLLLHGLRGERAALTELIRRIGSGELPISALSGDGQAPDAGATSPLIAPLGHLMFDHQQALALEWMNDAVSIARRPTPEWSPLWKEWEARVNRVRRNRLASFTSTLPILLTPVFSTAATAQAQYQAELGATALLIAAERQRRRSGEWPASLAAINRDLLATPPVDPFSGRAFHLERGDGRWLVYSIGPNGRDEHGAYDLKRWFDGRPDDFGAAGWDAAERGRPPEDSVTPPSPPGSG